MRKENDFLGEKSIEINALYGINSVRAVENFPYYDIVRKEWYRAIGLVKKACYITYHDFKKATLSKLDESSLPFDFIDDIIIEKMIEAAHEVSEGLYFNDYIVPNLQGGAGTSMNMNVNEIIANLTLQKIGKKKGEYQYVSPFSETNIYQSTNDVIPTALKIATMNLLLILEQKINNLRFAVEAKERQYSNVLRIAYTQLQQAVPSSYGKLFSTYNDALSRDWWRISKSLERIKTVNLGGSAIGTSMAVPTFFVMNVVKNLRNLTNLPINSGENLSDATNNLDCFVEVHAILKAHAVNLEKISNDIRLLASDIHGVKELTIPARQTGSSIMPGKVNPVIVEFIICSAHKIYSNDVLISSLVSRGDLDLNAYLPTIGYSVLESIEILIGADIALKENLFDDLKVNSSVSETQLYHSPAITTALSPYIGYEKASKLAAEMKKNDCDVFVANNSLCVIDNEKLKKILQAENLLKSGFSIYDIIRK